MLLRKILYMNRVLKTQYYNRAKLKQFQFDALRELVKYAKKHVPFYKNRYEHINPSNINSLKDFSKLPIITRDEFLSAGVNVYSEEFNNVNKEELRERCTSGSTGEGFKIKYDERAWDYLEAIYARAFFNQGYNPVFPMAYYWYEPLKKKFHNYFGLFRRHYIPCTWSIKRQIKELTNYNFRYIHYYSSVIYYISRVISKRDAEKIRPRAIFTHAEILSETMKKRIESTFRTKVYDMYGTTEFVRMAWECPICEEYHIDEDSIIFEVLDDNDKQVRPGQIGRVVVTGLANYLMPIIRYELGDFAILSEKKPSCGRALKLMKKVVGREKDFLIASSGERVPPRVVIDQLDPIQELWIFQVIQKSKRKFLVKILSKNPTTRLRSLIISKIKGLLGDDISVYITNQAPNFSPRGKLRLVYREF